LTEVIVEQERFALLGLMKGEWITLKKYSNKTKHKAAFLENVCHIAQKHLGSQFETFKVVPMNKKPQQYT
jgi:hypothetical protein|tara:strand:+ start:506 stop:715 length:210 start_codon:yes stop_codon:yes gene_type:complete